MDQTRIELLARFEVPPERLFAAMADHEGMSRWAGAEVSVIAAPADGGVGTVRRVRARGLTIDEEVVYFDPPRRFVYRIIRGLPVRHHKGEVLVEPWGEGGSQLSWTIELASGIPFFARAVAAALRPALNRGLRKLADELAAEPDARGASAARPVTRVEA